MPFTRPRAISNGVTLSDKLGREDWSLVSKDGTFDSGLLWDGVVDIVSPDEHGISAGSSENNVFSGTNELAALSSVFVFIATVMPLVEF
jgi:hypothetical protein